MSSSPPNSSTYCHSDGLVSLTTDYGYQSEGIGVMKGTILRAARGANIIDLCHSVAPGSVINGARIFEAIRFLPVGVHLCVVDPGVGTERRAIGVATRRGDILIGPDNGVMRNAVAAVGGAVTTIALRARLETGSCVFDGRDVFAYSASLIVSGQRSINHLGEAVEENQLMPSPLVDVNLLPELSPQIVHINRFGNVILNVRAASLSEQVGRMYSIASSNSRITAKVAPSFAHVAPGDAVICDDGFDRACVAINRSSAERALRVHIEERVELRMVEAS